MHDDGRSLVDVATAALDDSLDVAPPRFSKAFCLLGMQIKWIGWSTYSAWRVAMRSLVSKPYSSSSLFLKQR
ncbi:hypothetical protein RJ55_05653 [Drechmeria coniospora]|nr:hypothetical protein RJ55_05653 [Drechmeria coniospora]